VKSLANIVSFVSHKIRGLAILRDQLNKICKEHNVKGIKLDQTASSLEFIISLRNRPSKVVLLKVFLKGNWFNDIMIHPGMFKDKAFDDDDEVNKAESAIKPTNIEQLIDKNLDERIYTIFNTWISKPSVDKLLQICKKIDEIETV
jgi:hypothetical protein